MPDLTISVTLTPTEPTPPKGYHIVGYGIRALCNISPLSLKLAGRKATEQLSKTMQVVCYAANHDNDVMAGEWSQTRGEWSWKLVDDLSNPLTEHM